MITITWKKVKDTYTLINELHGRKVGSENTYSFSNGQIWPDDIFGINQKYIPYVQMICRDKNAAQLFIPIISLQHINS